LYHPRFKGKPYEMGQKMGHIFKRNNAQFPINLDEFQLEYGKQSAIILEEYFPEATAEIKGITDVIGYDNILFTSWMMCMGCCLDLNEEESIEVRGCTAFSIIHNDRIIHGRNNDLPPYLKKVSKSIFYKPYKKLSFILNTSSFINGEEGINEAGLLVAMTFVKPKIEEIKPGLNSVFLVRYILENCENVNEGIKALEKLPIASSCNIIMTDKQSNMVVVECNPLQMHIRYPESNKNGIKFIITVNNFTSKEMWKHDASDRNNFLAEVRYKTAFDALMKIDFTDSIEYTKAILSGEYGFICQYDNSLNFDTIWSSIFDISNNKIYRAEGNPQKVKFIEDKRLSK